MGTMGVIAIASCGRAISSSGVVGLALCRGTSRSDGRPAVSPVWSECRPGLGDFVAVTELLAWLDIELWYIPVGGCASHGEFQVAADGPSITARRGGRMQR